MYTTSLFSVAALLAATAIAAPLSEDFSSLSGGFEIETRSTYPTCNKNCTQFSLNDDSFTAEWYSTPTDAASGMRVPYDLLWTKSRELCTDSACDSSKMSTAELRTTSNTGVHDLLTLRLDGQFPANMKDDLFKLVQNGFYKGMGPVKTDKMDQDTTFFTATGPGYINVNYFGANGGSGAHLTAWIVKEKADGLNVCSVLAGTINALGSGLVPELDPIFGVVSAACAAT